MLNEILIGEENNNFYNLYVNENDKNKCIRINLNEIYLPFGLENYKNKYVINFEINTNKSCCEFQEIVRKLERNIPNLIDIDDIDVKSVFSKKQNFALKCRAYIKKNKNKIITLYEENKKEISIFEIKKCNFYNIIIEVSGIWKYKNTSGIYLNIIKIYK